VGDWLERLKDLAQHGADAVRTTVEREEAALVVGQVAGKTVLDDEGCPIVEAGMRITPDMTERARLVGRLHALVGAVATANVQDLRERLDQARQNTAAGQEETALDCVEDYAEARQCVGRVAVTDVTDVRGAVVIRGGTRLDEGHIRAAREARLLRALIVSASMPQPEPAEPSPSTPAHPEADASPPPDPSRRPRLPLVDMPAADTDQA